MYDELRARVGGLLRQARPLKPQTQRQLEQHLSEHTAGPASFLLAAAEVLEDYELDILFGPVFTPTLEDRAAVADLLYHWRPDEDDIKRLMADLGRDVPHALIQMPDGSEARLTLHEVMIERFVRLLRLEHGPDATTAAALRDALPPELWPVAVALLCERGMTRRHQAWLASFVNHMAARHPVTSDMLRATADFVARCDQLDRETLLAAAEALMRATEGTAAFAAGGHTYWSADVAQHHQYRGQGRVDEDRINERQAELEHVTTLVEDLRSFPES